MIVPKYGLQALLSTPMSIAAPRRRRRVDVVWRPMMRLYGRSTLAEYLGDFVVFRALRPVDARLPDLEALRSALGLRGTGLPRKTEPEYAAVVAEMMRRAHRLQGGDGTIESLVVLGDTLRNDGAAFRNICRALGCGGAAFIASDGDGPPRLEPVDGDEPRVFTANRWRLLEEFAKRVLSGELEVGLHSVVLVDIDKTALGARGRNHRPIDDARLAAVGRTATELLGGEVDQEAVAEAYRLFSRPAFHGVTTDNQDYLAYLCLLVAGGWRTTGELAAAIEGGEIAAFEELLERVAAALDRLPDALREVHERVSDAVAAGDPTPFKDFRKAEFVETVLRMGGTPEESDLARVLDEKLMITHEVREWALLWRQRGALVMGLSDKPDEASLPTPDLAERGWLPLHRTEAFVVGEG
jgi:hypothetical protein